ncbi:MAG: NAD(P)-dependent oxidoreductase [Alphaproteobacteria bacterium]
MIRDIGFIGLGVMGFHMAAHLLKNKFNIHIVNRKSLKTKKFLTIFKNYNNLFVSNELGELSKNSDVIITCVGNDKDLQDVYLSKKGIVRYITKKMFLIDHTTCSVKVTKAIYKKCLERNSYFYDAPMSGGEIGAVNGSLSLMVGGNKKQFRYIRPILDKYSKSLIYMGETGSGQISKMVNQICVASIIQGLAEAINFAKKKKIKIDLLVDVLKNGAAQSWQLENRAITMSDNKFNFGFMNKLMLKDLNLVMDEVKNTNIRIPTTKLIKDFYSELVKLGYEKEDTSNLIRLLK